MKKEYKKYFDQHILTKSILLSGLVTCEEQINKYAYMEKKWKNRYESNDPVYYESYKACRLEWMGMREKIQAVLQKNQYFMSQIIQMVNGEEYRLPKKDVRAVVDLIDSGEYKYREWEDVQWDSIIKDLLETNIRQRGDIGGSAKKVGQRIKELERLYGIQLGGNRGNQYVVAEPSNSVLATQSDLAAKLGMSVDTLQNYKMLADMIPELEEHQKRHVLFIAEVIMVNKERGNVTDKKTKQQLAEELNINVKTMRNAGRYIEYIENIEKNIGDEKAEKLNDIIYNLQKNKKENVSYEQIKQLSMALPEEQIRIVDLIIYNGIVI